MTETEFYDRFHEVVLTSFLFWIRKFSTTSERDDADDLQETYLILLFEKKFHKNAFVDNWPKAIHFEVHNIISRIRLKQRRSRMIPVDPMDFQLFKVSGEKNTEEVAAEQIELERRSKAAKTYIRTLSKKDQAVVKEVMKGSRTPEIAEVLDRPRSTIWSIVHKLTKMFSSHFNGPQK